MQIKKLNGEIDYMGLSNGILNNEYILDEEKDQIIKTFKKDYNDDPDIEIGVYSLNEYIENLKDNQYYELEDKKIWISGYEDSILNNLDWTKILWNKDQNGEISIYTLEFKESDKKNIYAVVEIIEN
jgi:hypothetical protein